MKAGCLSPLAQAAQLGRMQGLRTSDREPLIAGQSFSSWRKKLLRSVESADLGSGMEYISHIPYIQRKRKKKAFPIANSPPSLRHYGLATPKPPSSHLLARNKPGTSAKLGICSRIPFVFSSYSLGVLLVRTPPGSGSIPVTAPSRR